MVTLSNSEHDTYNEGKRLGQSLAPGQVVALCGNLGAGKTVFTRGIAAALGVEMNVTSPTFTIVNEYPGRIPLFHFDMYRLESEGELFDIGWDDYLGRRGVCVVEWSEKVPGAFPPGTIAVRISTICENERQIEVTVQC